MIYEALIYIFNSDYEPLFHEATVLLSGHYYEKIFHMLSVLLAQLRAGYLGKNFRYCINSWPIQFSRILTIEPFDSIILV